MTSNGEGERAFGQAGPLRPTLQRRMRAGCGAHEGGVPALAGLAAQRGYESAVRAYRAPRTFLTREAVRVRSLAAGQTADEFFAWGRKTGQCRFAFTRFAREGHPASAQQHARMRLCRPRASSQVQLTTGALQVSRNTIRARCTSNALGAVGIPDSSGSSPG